MEDIDAVITQRSDVDGLTKAEIMELLEHLDLADDDEVCPVAVDGEHALAFGFIRNELANRVDLDMTQFVKELLAVVNDIKLETADCRYNFAGVRTLMYY